MRTFLRIILKPLSFLPAILMMYLIFSFSAQDADTSSQLSYKVSRKIVEIGADVLDADFEEWEIDSLASRFHGSIRKIAHMAEYFALAVSVAFPLYVYGLRGILLVIVAGLFCVAFACGDEYHQSQVAGRVPSKKDVAIDSIGIFAGIIFTRIVGWTGRKTIFRPLSKKKKKKEKYNTSPEVNMQTPPMAGPTNGSYAQYQPTGYNNGRSNNGYGNSSYSNSGYGNNGYGNNGYGENGYGNNGPAPSVYPPNSAPYYNSDSGNGYAPYPNNNGQFSRGYAPYPNNNGLFSGGYAPHPNAQPYPGQPYNRIDASENPDSLSVDMSFKKLMHEIKDQKKTAHTEKRTAKKPKLQGNEIPEDLPEEMTENIAADADLETIDFDLNE